MAEISLVSARKARLEGLAKRGDKNARRALDLQSHPNKFLSTTQVGITLIGILMGVYSGATLSALLEPVLIRSQLPVIAQHSHTIALTLVVIFITYLSLVLGELVPKRLGLSYPEGVA